MPNWQLLVAFATYLEQPATRLKAFSLQNHSHPPASYTY